MKIFVGNETQKTLITGLWLKAEPVKLQGGRIQVFEPTASTKIDDKCVIVIGKLAKDLVCFLDYFRKVSGDLFKVVISLAREYNAMRLALDGKRDLGKVTYFKR